MSNDNNFDFKFNFDDENIDISSSSTPKKDEFEDIVSSSDKISFSSFSDIDSTKYKRKKRGLPAFFEKINEWWKERSVLQKTLLIVATTIFTLLCLGIIWTVLPFELRGKVFSSAFGLMVLNLLVYFCIVWDKRKLQTVFMSIISVILSGLLILSLFFWIPFLNLIYNFDGAFTNDAEDLAALPAIDKNITNIALFGIDTRDTKSFSGNSDSIMILSLNSEQHTVKITSVMRDTLVPIEQNGSKKIYSKINSAYARGGAELAVRTLNSIFDLDITEYATVNFFGMAQIIEAVGGIEVELTEREVTARGYNNHGINDMIDEVCKISGYKPKDYYITKSGKQVLNGIQAVAYSRIRYVPNIWGTNNDYGRTDRQRFVMEQLFNKALTMKKSSYPGLVKALIPYTVTSLSPDEILSFAFTIMAKSPTFQQERLPHNDYLMRSPSGSFGSVVYYDLDFASDLIHSFIYDDISFDEYTAENGIGKNDWYHKGLGNSSSSNNKKPSDNSNTNNKNEVPADQNNNTATNNDNSDLDKPTNDNNTPTEKPDNSTPDKPNEDTEDNTENNDDNSEENSGSNSDSSDNESNNSSTEENQGGNSNDNNGTPPEDE